MKSEITISLAVLLLASQVVVVIALIVLFKKFKALKDEVNKYRSKQNRTSLPMLDVGKSRDENNRPVNEYVDGKRHPSTIVRSYSKESVVYVPSPCPERRSRNLNEEEVGYGNSSEGSSTEVPVAPYTEEIHENDGFTRDSGDEIYDNQVVIDMVKKYGSVGSGSGVQSDTPDGYAMDVSKAGQTRGGRVCKSQKIANEQKQTSVESESTSEASSSYDGHHPSQDAYVTTEPIYENMRGILQSVA